MGKLLFSIGGYFIEEISEMLNTWVYWQKRRRHHWDLNLPISVCEHQPRPSPFDERKEEEEEPRPAYLGLFRSKGIFKLSKLWKTLEWDGWLSMLKILFWAFWCQRIKCLAHIFIFCNLFLITYPLKTPECEFIWKIFKHYCLSYNGPVIHSQAYTFFLMMINFRFT